MAPAVVEPPTWREPLVPSHVLELSGVSAFHRPPVQVIDWRPPPPPQRGVAHPIFGSHIVLAPKTFTVTPVARRRRSPAGADAISPWVSACEVLAPKISERTASDI